MIEPNDPHWEMLSRAAQAAKMRPRAWLEQSQFYGDLAGVEPFATEFEAWLSQIWSEGCRAALGRYAGR